MNYQQELSIICPYCGESISLLIDCTYNNQQYIEDCQVCCRPISLVVQYDANNSIDVQIKHENE